VRSDEEDSTIYMELKDKASINEDASERGQKKALQYEPSKQ